MAERNQQQASVNASSNASNFPADQFWGVHSTYDNLTSSEFLLGGNLTTGFEYIGSITIVSHTNDYWCFTWIDSRYNVCTTGIFEATMDMDLDPDIYVTIESDFKLTIVQTGGKTRSFPYYHVGSAG